MKDLENKIKWTVTNTLKRQPRSQCLACLAYVCCQILLSTFMNILIQFTMHFLVDERFI